MYGLMFHFFNNVQDFVVLCTVYMIFVKLCDLNPFDELSLFKTERLGSKC